MDIEKETSIEFKVITILLMVVGVVAILILIAFSTNLLEFRAESNAINIIGSEATQNSLTLKLENTHSNHLLINEVLVDGRYCQICTTSAIIKDRDELTISCADIKHVGSSYKHIVSIEFSDKKQSYTRNTQDLVSGSIQTKIIGRTSLTPAYEKIFFTEANEIISDVISNSCPQTIVTGSSEGTNNDFNAFLYSFDADAHNQQTKEWNLNTFDTGISLAQNALGKTIIFGHTYHATQGGDTVILTTDDYIKTFATKISGTAKSEVAKKILIDSSNDKYLMTEVNKPKTLLIQKQDVSGEEIWSHSITLSQLSTFLSAELYDEKLHIITSSLDASQSKLIVFDSYGTQERVLTIPGVMRSFSFDTDGNSVFVGEKKDQANSDASIIRYSKSWKQMWNSKWGEGDDEQYNDVTISEDGTIFVVGSFEISLNNHKSFLHKYDAQGVLIDSYLFRAPQSLKVTHVELTQEGLYAIGETYDGSQHDVYIAKFE